MVKPFAFAELLARLRVLLRRGRADRETVLRCGDLEMDLLQRQVALSGDEGRLRRVFYNLLDNAIKYTPERGRIAVALLQQDHRAIVTVRDSGIGIPPEHLLACSIASTAWTRPAAVGKAGPALV
jgi:signal transduction histidine kinase